MTHPYPQERAVGDVIEFPQQPADHDEDSHGAQPAGPTGADTTAKHIESGEDSDVAVQLVDDPNAPDLPWLDTLKASERRAIIPAYLTNREDRRTTVRFLTRHYAHIAAFHTVRVPIYTTRAAVHSPLGAGRILRHVGRWALDLEAHEMHKLAIKNLDTNAHLKLSERRSKRIRARLISTAVGAASLGVGVWLIPEMLPTWAEVLAGCAVVGVLGMVGRPIGHPFITRAVVNGEVEKLTSDVVVRALCSLGMASMSEKNSKNITFPSPITRDGPGWRADVDLPHGVTVTDILDKRDRLASGLRRNLGCVWPEGDVEQHAGRLVLWCGDKPLRETKQPAWPLRRGTADVFRPLPFGIDVRGQLVTVTLMFGNLLIGAMPRQGKTGTLRSLLLAAALDANCELRIFELKGTGDLGVLEGCCHHYASGAGDDALEAALSSLRDLHAQLVTRAKTINDLYARNRALVPDNKVTPQVSADRTLGLHPILAALDECQELFSHPDYKDEAAALATAIIKRGPALGIMLVLATQRPDKDSLPKGISDNVALRFCLKVEGNVANDMVLGVSAYQAGHRATIFTPIKDAGIGILKGVRDQPFVARSFYFGGPESERITDRARALRAAAGTLTGHAIGEVTDADDQADKLLTDILAVIPAGTDKVWSETVVDHLTEAFPGRYAAWADLDNGGAKASALAAALKPYRVRTAQTWGITDDGRGANRQGITRDSVADVLTERNSRKVVG